MGAVVAGVAGAGLSLYSAHKQRKAQREAEREAARAQAEQLKAAEYANALQQSASGVLSASPDQQTMQDNEQLSEQAAESARKRRFSLSRSINRGGILGATAGKQTLG